MKNQDNDFITIEFTTGGIGRSWDGYGDKLKIPVKGDINPVPSCIKKVYKKIEEVLVDKTNFNGPNMFNEYRSPHSMVTHIFDLNPKERRDWEVAQLRWVEERKEWVVAVYQSVLDGFDEGCEYWEGPFAIDDYCGNILKKAYLIPQEKLTTQEISRTNPSKLEGLANSK